MKTFAFMIVLLLAASLSHANECTPDLKCEGVTFESPAALAGKGCAHTGGYRGFELLDERPLGFAQQGDNVRITLVMWLDEPVCIDPVDVIVELPDGSEFVAATDYDGTQPFEWTFQFKVEDGTTVGIRFCDPNDPFFCHRTAVRFTQGNLFTAKAGDADADGDADVDDMMSVFTLWNSDNTRVDFNRDGVVNVDDLGEVFTNWGT